MRIDIERAQELALRYPGRVTIRPLLEDVTAEWEPDPSWSFTDAAGHTHRWVAKAGFSLWWTGTVPTIGPAVVGTYWCEDCQDDHEETEQRCLLCREVVRPGYVRSMCRREILIGYDLDPMEFRAFQDGELSPDQSVFTTPAGDTFRVHSFIEEWGGLATVQVYPQPPHLT